MKKIYLSFFSIVFIGISLGILYISFWSKSGIEIPKNIEMNTAYGETFSFDKMEPKVRIIEFMYTRCPDVCPVTTTKMKQLRDRLERENVFDENVEFLTITVDPDRDTDKILQAYAEKFKTIEDNGWLFLRGNKEDTKAIANALGFMYTDPGSGNITHTSYAFLLNKKNQVIKEINMGEGFNVDSVYKAITREIK